MKKYFIGGYVIVFICAAITGLAVLAFGGVIGGPTHRDGELEPYANTAFAFECRKDEDCTITVRFRPKYQKERSDEECKKFKLMLWVDDSWFETSSGALKYVETFGTEELMCDSTVGYGGGHKMANKNRKVTVQLTNGNIWKGIYQLDTN